MEHPGGEPDPRAASSALDDGGDRAVPMPRLDPRCWVFLLGQCWAQVGSSGLGPEPAFSQPQPC